MGQTLDEDELDEELAELQQEELDNKMLETGQVPVTDKVSRLPTGPQGERTRTVYFPHPKNQMADIRYPVPGKKAVHAEEEDEEEELRKLQAEMAM